jgi:hypothetical protein
VKLTRLKTCVTVVQAKLQIAKVPARCGGTGAETDVTLTIRELQTITRIITGIAGGIPRYRLECASEPVAPHVADLAARITFPADSRGVQLANDEGRRLRLARHSEPGENTTHWKRLLDFLQAHRETDFGETRFQSLQLIWNDWGASNGATRTLQKYTVKD